MARPRKPTDLLKISGAFKKNPKRKREDVAVTGEIGEPPVYFNVDQKECWKEIVRNAPVGVLKNSDRIAVEIASKLLNDSRQNWLDFDKGKLLRLETLLGKFGMTPADRSKVAGASEKEDNNLDKLFFNTSIQ